MHYSLRPNARQLAIAESARQCQGDVYDSNEYPGGPPPRGRGACTDVVYYALKPVVDLQAAVNSDSQQYPESYGGEPNPDLDYRWCPKLMVWFQRHGESLTTEVGLNALWKFQAGDIVFYDDGTGVPGHVGVVSERRSWDGKPLLIHNPAPHCVEENALASNRIVGHFRVP